MARVTGYGKGAIVGSAGELEHAAALIHPKFGAPVRKRLGRGPAIIPSTKKFGGPGSSIKDDLDGLRLAFYSNGDGKLSVPI